MRRANRSPPGRPNAGGFATQRQAWGSTVWLFDLDDTLHDAGAASMPAINAAMTTYVQRELQLSRDEADALRQRYWRRYGATLLGLIRHHGVKPGHFLHDTHHLPGLEQRVKGHRHDFDAIAQLHGTKLILTNAPRVYALRVLRALRVEHLFDAVLSIEDMVMFGRLRPSPTPACCGRCARGCACIQSVVCWWKTRCATKRRRGAWACARCGCGVIDAARPPPRAHPGGRLTSTWWHAA